MLRRARALRGPGKFWFKTYDYCQAQVPIREQQKVVGHAVRAMYLYSAAADLAGENDDASLLDTCDRRCGTTRSTNACT